MCVFADAGGGVELCNMRSLIHNASEYVEELQRCIGDVSEKHGVQYAGLYSDRVTLSRYCLKPNSSVGALNGASYQLLGADMESLNRMGLYLKSKMVSECSHRRHLIQHTR